MAGARYTGVWAATAAQVYEDPERFTVNTPPDPTHGDNTDATAPLMMDAPVLPSGGEIHTDVIVEETDGLPAPIFIDDTPVDGQGTAEHAGHGFGGTTRLGVTSGQLAGPRGDDKGAARRATSDSPTYRFFNETFFGYFTKGFEPPPITVGINNPVFIRGINSHPVNNGPQDRPTAWSVEGDGWKRGDYESSNVERDFHPPLRHHREIKYVEPDIVTIIGDAPPPDKSDTYASPFSSLQKFMPKRRRVRGMRRQPGAWDEDLVALPAGEISTGSADGMVVN
jgi:hypothetical protein